MALDDAPEVAVVLDRLLRSESQVPGLGGEGQGDG